MAIDEAKGALIKILVPGGEVSAILDEPAVAEAMVVLGHGAGSDLSSKVLVAIARGLAARGFATLRFNFLYRQMKKNMPDRAPVLEATWRAVAAFARARSKRLVIGGHSMGGRYATIIASKGEATDGLLLLGYPLHPPKKVEQLRKEHLPSVAAPMLFVSGTRDALCTLDLFRPIVASLGERAELHLLEGGDHSLEVPKGLKRAREDVEKELLDRIEAWLRARVVSSSRP